MTSRPSNVYVIASGAFVKIGVAYDVKRRLKAISNGCPVKPELFGSIQYENNTIAHQMEQRAHEFFWKYRRNGEWFEILPEQALALLQRMEPLPMKPGQRWYYDARQTPESLETMREALNAASPVRQ